MKFRLYTLAAALLAIGALSAQAETGVVVDANGGDTYGVPFDATYTCSLTQTLYKAEFLQKATNNAEQFTINSLQYTISGLPSTGSGASMKVYMTAVNAENLASGYIPQDQWKLVYTGTITTADVMDQKYTLDLNDSFSMNSGEALVITTEATRTEWAWWYICYGDKYDCTGWQTCTWSAYGDTMPSPEKLGTDNYATVPALTIGYSLGAADESFKLGLELDGPTATSVNKKNNFTVNVTNKGTETASGYTINLLGEDRTTVLATAEGVAVAPGTSETVTVPYTFPTRGEMTIFAEAVKGDASFRSPGFKVEVTPEVPEDYSTVVIPENAKTTHYMYFQRNFENSGVQSIFVPEYFSDFNGDLDIYSLGLTLNDEGYAIPSTITISLAAIDRNTPYDGISTVVPASEFTEVFKGPFNSIKADSQTINMFLDQKFTLEKGKSLVVNFAWYTESPYSVNVLGVSTEEAYSYTCSSGDPTQATRGTNLKFLPAITFGYTLAAAPEAVDLSAVAGSDWPIEANVGVPVRFPVTVSNVGTVAVPNYRIELLDYSKDLDNPEVIATNDITRNINPGSKYNGNVTYTFSNGGMYFIGARVVAEGDVNGTNDMTEPEVIELPLPAVDLQVIGIEAPTNVKTEEEVEITLEIYNGGSERVSTYTIQIEGTKARELLANVEIQSPLFSQYNEYKGVPVIFTEPGVYEVVGRVIIADDANEENNVSEPITINVESTNTGISTIGAELKDAKVYNLQGIRITNVEQLPAGVYIINGKKVVIK